MTGAMEHTPMRNTFISALSLIAILVVAIAPASAQQDYISPDQIPEPVAFGVEEAADCAASFGWILRFLAPNGMPEEAAVQADIAFLIWGYELARAKPEATQTDQDAHAQAAVNRLNAELPAIVDDASAKLAIDTVIAKSAACAEKISEAYPDGFHPVVLALEQEMQNQPEAGDAVNSIMDDPIPLQ